MKRAIAAAVALALAVACTRSGPGSPGAAGHGTPVHMGVDRGPVKLTVWDQDVRTAQDTEITRLNGLFEKEHPNVTIARVARSFFDLKSRLQNLVSGGKLPDVVQVNQGWADMGQLVRSGLLRPLDPWNRLYHWENRYSPSLVDFNSFSPDGKSFGEGSLFGLSQEGELVGVYYNKSKLRSLHLAVPKTLAGFEHDLAVAKKKGQLPIQFGNLDKFPGIHEFQALQNEFTPEEKLRDLVLGRSEASFETKPNLLAASKLRSWVQKGYFPRGFNSTGYNDAWAKFVRGDGVFLITGTWLSGDLDRGMRGNVGFFLMPAVSRGRASVATGGEGLAFAITSQSQHPNTAAAYIDFLTGARAGRVIVAAGGLPAMKVQHPRVPRDTSLHDIFRAWRTISKQNGLVPYLDYATPTFYGVITAAVQNLMSSLVSPRRFLTQLQQNYSTFQSLR